MDGIAMPSQQAQADEAGTLFPSMSPLGLALSMPALSVGRLAVSGPAPFTRWLIQPGGAPCHDATPTHLPCVPLSRSLVSSKG